jgi:hypothetical protein
MSASAGFKRSHIERPSRAVVVSELLCGRRLCLATGEVQLDRENASSMRPQTAAYRALWTLGPDSPVTPQAFYMEANYVGHAPRSPRHGGLKCSHGCSRFRGFCSSEVWSCQDFSSRVARQRRDPQLRRLHRHRQLSRCRLAQARRVHGCASRGPDSWAVRRDPSSSAVTEWPDSGQVPGGISPSAFACRWVTGVASGWRP